MPRQNSRIISGRSSDTTYEATENLNPGKTSSVTAAPLNTCLRCTPARASLRVQDTLPAADNDDIVGGVHASILRL